MKKKSMVAYRCHALRKRMHTAFETDDKHEEYYIQTDRGENGVISYEQIDKS